jgi:2-amino-4,5-dihydroxy-6-oxo-7-(phosphonooxy)heptanoate synthase
MNTTFARQLRLNRLSRRDRQRLFIVPLDHAVTDGPIYTGSSLDTLVRQLAANGVDGIVLHKGSLRRIDPRWFTETALIVHLSASTAHAPDPDNKYLVAGVEEALQMGADAVSVHVNLGSREEPGQVADLARVSDACERWNVPLLAMMYPRGPRVTNPRDPQLLAHAGTLAAELGADVVKLPFAESAAAMRDVVQSCPIPVVTAGGARLPSADLAVHYVEDVLSSGAAGVAMGRNIFQADDPAAITRKIADLVHGRFETAGAPAAGPAIEATIESTANTTIASTIETTGGTQ